MSQMEREDVRRLYRAVADGEPQREIMQMIYDLFRQECELRPPAAELRLARLVGAGGGTSRG